MAIRKIIAIIIFTLLMSGRLLKWSLNLFHIFKYKKTMKLDLNDFFERIVEAKKSGLYSDHEINFFYDVWHVSYINKLKEKYKGKKDDK